MSRRGQRPAPNMFKLPPKSNAQSDSVAGHGQVRGNEENTMAQKFHKRPMITKGLHQRGLDAF